MNAPIARNTMNITIRAGFRGNSFIEIRFSRSSMLYRTINNEPEKFGTAKEYSSINEISEFKNIIVEPHCLSI
jgi:hypothetical protein